MTDFNQDTATQTYFQQVVIHTDGACKGNPGPGKGITEWIQGWKARGWRTAAKAPVKNVDLWQQLDALLVSSGHTIDWRWVRGHTGDPGNERADALANKGVERALGRL